MSHTLNLISELKSLPVEARVQARINNPQTGIKIGLNEL